MKSHHLWFYIVVAANCSICAQSYSFTQPIDVVAGKPTQRSDNRPVPEQNQYDPDVSGAPRLKASVLDANVNPADAHAEPPYRMELAEATDYLNYLNDFVSETLDCDNCGEFFEIDQPVKSTADTFLSGECPDFQENRNVYYGDLHVHTNFSHDGFAFGNHKGPAGAYADVQGQVDFAAVTDHAEFFAETLICRFSFLPGHNLSNCQQLRAGSVNIPSLIEICKGSPPLVGAQLCTALESFIWQKIQDANQQANLPCQFTTFVGYEYSLLLGAKRLHRNVIFDSENVPAAPVNYIDQPNPAELWQTLTETCLAESGCQALVIPHTSNVSQGEMFSPLDIEGNALTFTEAQLRAELEKVVEMFQHKGNSECYPEVGNNDPDCAFEQVIIDRILPPGETEVPRLSFAREGLKEGLQLQKTLGVNPFQFGFIGGTDTHSSAPGAVDETTYVGHVGLRDDTAMERISNSAFKTFNPGGLAAVWARENTRPEIFAALQRRETYATSGTRIALRFFGGWDLPADSCDQPDLPALGYAKGVPMGDVLPAPIGGQFQPTFVVQALQDPASVPLYKIQIIRGWTDFGSVREDVLTVLEVPEGAAELCVVWTDTEFNSIEPGFYYARVFEQDTSRWSLYDCQDNNINCSDPGSVPPEFSACCDDPQVTDPIQERAWSSPIWYTPSP